ncbi:DJ-1/PfpI family protein [Hujiaoplasma nucleasis]|uniref:DJ-1/PfpI family protein n=1 Tax=Hujiaoplasma nucleasis TaxID=2725268 RepID=A0A7L6N4Y2_9MOLU|nr:DJ-1/PfpI family protein [Hujiaoplasma nucleasis]QLY40327.1 DJ-1/PfpI family protein [Hujiaoplasma nucleasis]
MKLACLLADGFEDVEALATSALLRRAKFTVDFYSVYNQEKVTGAYHTVVTDLLKIKDLNPDDYDGLLIPGGRAAFKIRDEQSVKDIARAFHQKDKWMFAICAAPTVFGLLGLLDGKKYISFPGTEKEMGQAIRVNEKAVRDEQFITGRSAGSVYDFVFKIIETIQGPDALQKFKENIVY